MTLTLHPVLTLLISSASLMVSQNVIAANARPGPEQTAAQTPQRALRSETPKVFSGIPDLSRVEADTMGPSPSWPYASSEKSELSSSPGDWGPYGVGVTTLKMHDDSRNRTTLVDVWYPAYTTPEDGGEYYYHMLWGAATRDATPDTTGAPFPLIVFSHGSGGMRDQSVFYTEHLASHGYIVFAPDHPGNTLLDTSEDSMARAVVDRPLDVTFVIDQALAMSEVGSFPVADAIDPARIGVTGHSFGAYTTHAICGARLAMWKARESCAEGDDFMCQAIDYAESIYGEGLDWLDMSDDRVSACIPMAPGIYDYFQDEGLSSTFAPVGMMASGHDTVLDYETEAVPMYEALPEPKYMLTLIYRDHYAFSSLSDIRPAAGSCESLEDCPDRDQDHVIINEFATAFFGYYLYDDASYLSYLDSDYFVNTYAPRVAYDARP